MLCTTAIGLTDEPSRLGVLPMERNRFTSRQVPSYAPSLGGHSSSYVCEIPPIVFSPTQRVLAALKGQIYAMLAM